MSDRDGLYAELRLSLARELAKLIPRGSKWKHYKGDVFTVLAVSMDLGVELSTDAMDAILVTVEDEDGEAFSRTAAEFLGRELSGGHAVSRFERVP